MQDDIRDRYQSARRDYTTVPQRTHRPATPAGEPKPSPKKSKESKRGSLLGAILFVVIIGLAISGWSYLHRDKGPLPEIVVKSTNFPIYYPSPMPSGFAYSTNTAKVNDDILFFKLNDGAKSVVVSEQKIPNAPPDLNSLQGFERLYTKSGISAVITNGNGKPTAIILTKTTLITVADAASATKDEVGQIAANLTSLN